MVGIEIVRYRLICLFLFVVVGTAAIDDIGAEGLYMFYHFTGDYLDINFVPLTIRPIRAIPVSKKGSDSAIVVACLHPCDEFTVLKCLICFNFA